MRALTSSCGVTFSWSFSDNRSLIVRATRDRPTENKFDNSSPTVRARRLPAAPLQGELRDIMVTSTWFTPGFPLKDKLKDLSLAIEEVLRS